MAGEDSRNACYYMGIQRLARSLYSSDRTVKWDTPEPAHVVQNSHITSCGDMGALPGSSKRLGASAWACLSPFAFNGNINYRINWQKFHAKEGAAALLGGDLVVNSFQNILKPLKSSLCFVLAGHCKLNSFQFIQ